MQIIPAAAYPQRDKASLGIFLAHCRDLAAKSGAVHYASISLDLDFAAPLAVLDLIREPGEPHFYLERQAANEAVAAAEAIVDGWQVVQFPHQQAPIADRDLEMVGYEFILQKMEIDFDK